MCSKRVLTVPGRAQSCGVVGHVATDRHDGVLNHRHDSGDNCDWWTRRHVAEKSGRGQDRVFQVSHGTQHSTCHLSNYTKATERCPMDTEGNGALLSVTYVNQLKFSLLLVEVINTSIRVNVRARIQSII